MSGHRHDAAALADALAQRVQALAAELLPAGRRHGQEWRAGSLAGEPGQSLAVHLSGAKAGVWSDFASGERGDALDLVAAVLFRGNVRDALDWTRAWLGIDSDATPQQQRRPVPEPQDPAQDDTERTARAREAWQASAPAPGTPAALYLAQRGLAALSRLPVLRWHPAATHPGGGRHPAMLALVQGADGTPMGIHRTYLTDAGGRRADLSPGKASLGPIGGGAVRLHPPAGELVIGEGIESSASAGLLLDLPAWAALSTSGLRTLLLPDEVRRVVIAADPDPPGEDAAQAAATRWTAEGRTVRIARPTGPGDFNDTLAALAAEEHAHG